MPAPEDVLPPGTLVGQYRIEGVRSQGGMAVVYQATHPVIEKRAAIKVIHRKLASDPGLIRRFVDEARAVNQIGHPNIVDVFAFGELPDGRSFMVMEWLEGESLEARLQQGMLQPDVACEVLLVLCDALAAAHERGIVHRDLKPANVQVLSEGPMRLKLLDFGIAALGGKTTGEQGVVGTPDYMAPEQAVGEAVSAATDVYALGVIAYELVTGCRPFDEATVEKLLLAHLQTPPPRSRSVNPTVPPVFDRLIDAMLAKHAAHRPTLEQVRAQLRILHEAASINAGFVGLGLTRPAFERTFTNAADVAPSLLADLTRGHLVAVSEDPAPGAGTPIYVIFKEVQTGLVARLGATVESAMGQDQRRALLRFDAPPREGVARLASFSPATAAVSSTGQAEGRWKQSSTPLDLPTVPGVPEKSATALLTQSVARPTLSMEVVEAELPAEPLPEPEVKATSAGVRGLASKILGLTAAVTVLSVLGVAALAYTSIRDDRADYFQGSALNAAIAIEQIVRGRIEQASAAMVALDAEDVPDLVVLAKAMASCSASECRQLRGEEDPQLQSVLRGLTESKRPLLMAQNDDVLFVQPQNGRAVGTVFDAQSLVPKDVTAPMDSTFLVSPTGDVLMTFGRPGLSLETVPTAGSGTQLTKSKGEEFVVAWRVSPEFSVVTQIPTRTSQVALEELLKDVAITIGFVLLVALIISLLFSRQLTGRLRRLATHADRMSKGDFSPPRDIRGQDEVGQLAQALQDMAQALEGRDREIIKIQRDARADDARSAQRDTVDALQARVMDSLHRIEALTAEGQAAASLQRVRTLSKEAQSALQQAGVTAGVARARLDFASVVEEAVSFAARTRNDVALGFSAPNAVLFPRVERPESLLREVIRELSLAFIKSASQGESGRVVLGEQDGTLNLEFLMKSAAGTEAVTRRVQALGEPLALLSRSVKLGRRTGLSVLMISFETEAPT